MENQELPKSGRPRWLGWGLAALLVVLLGAILVLFTPIGFTVGGQSWSEFRNAGEYDRHRDRYDAIVAALRAKVTAPGDPRYFYITPEKDPATLREVDPEKEPDLFLRVREREILWAQLEPSGRFVVRICTYSMGHAGVYGLVYSSAAPPPGELQHRFGTDGRVAQVAPN